MGDFRRDSGKSFGGRSEGRPNFSRKNRGESSGRDRGLVTMHQAVCDQCGNPCEVPFQPTEGKPVYCNVCFGEKRNSGSDRGGDRFPQKNFNSFNKAPAKTEFGNNAGRGNDELKKQLELLNVKMDRLIRAVEALNNAKPLPFVVDEKAKKAVKTFPEAKTKKLAKKIPKKIKK